MFPACGRIEEIATYLTPMLNMLITGKSGTDYIFSPFAIEKKTAAMPTGVYVRTGKKDDKGLPDFVNSDTFHLIGINSTDTDFARQSFNTILLYYPCKNAEDVKQLIGDITSDKKYKLKIKHLV